MRWRVSDSLVLRSWIFGCSGDSDMTGSLLAIRLSGFHLSRAGDPKHKHAIAGLYERSLSVSGMATLLPPKREFHITIPTEDLNPVTVLDNEQLHNSGILIRNADPQPAAATVKYGQR